MANINGRLLVRIPKWRVKVGKWIALSFVGAPWSIGIVSEAWVDEKLNRIADWIVKGAKDNARIEWSEGT